jgi:heat shock protein HtpX
MKRIILFVATNLAVVVVLSVVLKLFGIDQAMASQGIAYGQLLV